MDSPIEPTVAPKERDPANTLQNDAVPERGVGSG